MKRNYEIKLLIISILTILQGVLSLIKSILCLVRGTLFFKFGSYSINANYNMVGVILGICLIITGIGIWYRKKYAYYSTIVLYYVLIITTIIFSIFFGLTFESLAKYMIVTIMPFLIVYYVIIKYIQNKKSEFK